MSEERPPFLWLRTEDLVVDECNVRLDKGEAGLEDSIRAMGVIQPLVVRRRPDGKYGVVVGSRRLNSAKKAGVEKVPCIVVEMEDDEAIMKSLAENLERTDISDYEVARALERLLYEYPDKYPTQKALAERFGKTQAWVSYHLRMLELEPVITRVIMDSKVVRNITAEEVLRSITEGHAREILSAPERFRPFLIEKIAMRLSQGLPIPSMSELRSDWMRTAEAEREEAPEKTMPKAPKAPKVPEAPKVAKAPEIPKAVTRLPEKSKEPSLEEKAKELGVELPKPKTPKVPTSTCPFCGSRVPVDLLELKMLELQELLRRFSVSYALDSRFAREFLEKFSKGL